MNDRLGIALMLLAMLSFSISDAFIKASDGYLTLGQSVFYLGILGVVLFTIYARILGQVPFQRHMLETPVVLRGLSEIMATGFIFYGILYGSLTKTISIHQIQPILVTFGAILIYKEHVGWRRWTAILLGFASVMLIIRPGVGGWDSTAIIAFFGAIGLAFRDLSTKAIGAHVSSVQLSIVGYMALIPLGMILIPYEGSAWWPGLENFPFIFGITIFSMIAYLAITESVRVAEFGTVMPFRFSRLFFVYAIGVLYFGETLDWQTIVGGVGILCSGLFVLIRTDRMGQKDKIKS